VGCRGSKEMTLSDWKALSDDAQQGMMRTAYEHHTKINIDGTEYSVELTFDGRFTLIPSGFLSVIRKWFR
jgi:hypothetical protein